MGWPLRLVDLLADRVAERVYAREGLTDPFFEQSLSAFLRHNAAGWRSRRIDRFEPVDINLARQQTTLQGVVTTQLLEAFARDHGGPLGVSIPGLHHAELTVAIPALSLPKRLLLDFDARAEDGSNAPAGRASGRVGVGGCRSTQRASALDCDLRLARPCCGSGVRQP
jgi:hypothetical protein